MDNTEISPPIESAESAESSQSMQALEDATYEPGSYLEQNSDVGTSEGAETTLTNLVESLTQPADQANLQPDRITREIDPTTGETTTSGGEPSSKSTDQEAVFEEDNPDATQSKLLSTGSR